MMDSNENNNIQEQDIKVEKQIENQSENQKKEKEKGKGAFYGILAFAIFIIMVVGATFAYFVASTGSDTGSVRTRSTKLQIDFISYTSAWMATNLIPVSANIAEYSVEQRPDNSGNKICIDDDGREICSIYVFQVRNGAVEDQDVTIKLESDTNGFNNLNAMIYEIEKGTGYVETASADDPAFATNLEDYEEEGFYQVQDSKGGPLFEFEPIYINRLGVKKTLLSVGNVKSYAVPVASDGESVDLADNVVIPGVNTGNNLKTYMIVLYINEIGDIQNDDDANSEFAGTVIVDGSDGTTQVTGRISTVDASQLQSNTTTT